MLSKELFLARLKMKVKIEHALKGIQCDSALGVDCMTSYFFVKIWNFAKTDICNVIRNIFVKGLMYKAINYTSITLQP